MADRSQISTGLSVYVYGGLHKVLTLPATLIHIQRINEKTNEDLDRII